MKHVRSLIWAGALLSLATAPSFAMGSWFPRGDHGGGKPPRTHSAPGPVIGLGLPALAAAGGYVWYLGRFRRRK